MKVKDFLGGRLWVCVVNGRGLATAQHQRHATVAKAWNHPQGPGLGMNNRQESDESDELDECKEN